MNFKLKNLVAAIQFNTIIPVGKVDRFDQNELIPYFPVVGLVLGLIVGIFDSVAFFFWPIYVVSALDVVLLIILTGAFHLDGLGDASDGLLGLRTREKALLIMKDSRIGVMALVAILCCIIIKLAGIMNIDSGRFLVILIIPAYSRAGSMFGIKFLEYGRPDGGTGQFCFNESLKISDFWGLLIPVVLSLYLGFTGIVLNVVFVGLVVLILSYYKKRMGCITGDMLGAMVEIVEAFLFLVVAAKGV